MAEKRIIIDKKTLNYSGLFSFKELYKVVDDWLQEHDYKKAELSSTESVSKDVKDINVYAEPSKKITDYAKYKIRINLTGNSLKKVEIQRKGKKLKLDSGTVNFMFWGDLETDFQDRWEQKAEYFLMRTLVDKFVYHYYMKGFEDGLRKDVEDLISHIKAYLNMER